jgi:UDPglucose 6-dehydrogenase
MSRRVSIVGLGKLGASMAAAIASRGHDVIGVDVNQRAVDALNAGRAPVQETGLQPLIEENRARLRGTMSHQEAISDSELTFVIVPTPSDDRGAFSLQYVAFAFREIGKALATKPGPHTVVLTSTVLPGAMRHGLLPILEQHSRKKGGEGFGLCYSPEFIALGSVIRDFLNPDFLLIGELDAASGEHLAACYADIVGPDVPVRRMTLENAELAKISVNAFVTTKITFANMLAEMCAAIPGGDVDVVSDALGLDSRIGRKYLTGGLGFGGPCFPRDNVALGFMANALGARADLPATTDALNRLISERILQQLWPRIGHDVTVAVLGLAYKPASHVTEESQAIMIVKAFLDHGARVLAYDPLARESANFELGGRALILDSACDCIRDADVVLIATPDPEFKRLSARDFRTNGRTVLVVDFWRILPSELAGAPGGWRRRRRAQAVVGRDSDALWTLTSRLPTYRSTRFAPSGTRGRATSGTRPRRWVPASTSTRSNIASTSSSRTFPRSPTSRDGVANASWRSDAASARTRSTSPGPARRSPRSTCRISQRRWHAGVSKSTGSATRQRFMSATPRSCRTSCRPGHSISCIRSGSFTIPRGRSGSSSIYGNT